MTNKYVVSLDRDDSSLLQGAALNLIGCAKQDDSSEHLNDTSRFGGGSGAKSLLRKDTENDSFINAFDKDVDDDEEEEEDEIPDQSSPTVEDADDFAVEIATKPKRAQWG